MKKIVLGLSLILGLLTAKAQEEGDSLTLEQRIKKLEDKHSNLEGALDALKKLKITGYIQAQYQVAQQDGIASFIGGNFPANMDKRFAIRRGRVAFTYEGNLSKYVLQIDATEKGASVVEAYAKITEPWSKWISLQVGIQNRPFGNEVNMSSSAIESLERGRLSQIIFPSEQDLGAQIIINAPKTSPLNFLTLQAGFFNGTSRGASEFDRFKDFIGRLSFIKSNKNETVTYSGGVSYYDGGYFPGNGNLYELTGNNTFTLTNTALTKAKRQHYGVDAQVSFQNPAGFTTLRAEYVAGKQSGTSSTTASPTAQPAGDTYLRNFNGAYFYFIHDIAGSKLSLVAKYDWYNPNKDVDQSMIGTAGTKTTAADIKYSTFGLGLACRWDKNIRITAYYDMVKNKSTMLGTSANPLTNYTADIKDNVFTLRVQYKF